MIVGEKEPLSDSRIRFTHAVDLREIMTALKTNRPLLECRSGPDIGEFSPVEGSANRCETGTMVHPATGVPTEYVEIWRLLDPIRTTFETEVAEGDAWDATVCTATYRYSEGKRQGRVIVLGNWVQGVIYDSLEKKHPLSVMRAHRDDSGEWRFLIKYGKDAFPPLDSLTEEGWTQIE